MLASMYDTFLYDSRPVEEGGHTYAWSAGKPCDKNMMEINTLKGTRKYGDIDLIHLCNKGWDAWMDPKNKFSQLLDDVTEKKYKPSRAHLHDFAKSVMAVAFAHIYTYSGMFDFLQKTGTDYITRYADDVLLCVLFASGPSPGRQ